MEDEAAFVQRLGATPKGTFAELPQEILDTITTYVFPVGYTSFIRTSKSIYAATRAALYSYGIYRVDVLRYLGRMAIYYSIDNHQASHHVPSEIQNIEIRVALPIGSASYPLDYRRPDDFQELGDILLGIIQPVRRPIHCRVRLALGEFANFIDYELASMKVLQNFRTVTLKLCTEPVSKAKLDDLRLLAPLGMHPVQRINKAIGLLEESLVTTKDTSKNAGFIITVPKDLASPTLGFVTDSLHGVDVVVD